MPKKVSVIIPALNEEKTIGAVVEEIYKSEYVDEIIVIDNNSTDDTGEIARSCGAKTIVCRKMGYGYAMKAGIESASRDWIFKIDADIRNPKHEWVAQMVLNITSETRLLKGYWLNNEDPMPVTNLVAKPSLKKLEPELSEIHMPISGIYLFSKDIYQSNKMVNNFAFDIQLLIECHRAGFKIKQEFLGEVYDTYKPVSSYTEMSFQILSYMMDSYKKQIMEPLMVFMAHPDDSIIWSGGTIVKYLIAGKKVKVIIATGDPNHELNAIESMFPNLTISTLNFAEFENFTTPQSVTDFTRELESFRPSIFITHHRDDPHMDHRSCFNLATAALIKINRQFLPNKVLMSNCYFQTTLGKSDFSPDVYINTSDEMALKIELLKKFESADIPHWQEMFTKLDELNGFKCSVKSAESFETLNFYKTPKVTEFF